MQFLAIDHQADAVFARDHLLEREPPGFADTVGKRGRHVNGERHPMRREHRIGRRDQILIGAVERQADEAPALGERHRPSAHLVHRDDIVFPALQRPDRAVEESRRDFAGFQRLKTHRTPRAHALESQDDAGTAGLASSQPRNAAEIGKFQLQAGQQSVVGWQLLVPRRGDVRLAPAALSLLFVDISLQRSDLPKNVNISL